MSLRGIISGVCGQLRTFNTPPSFVACSAMAYSAGGITVNVPTGYAEDDLLVLFLDCTDAYNNTPDGWTLLDTQSVTGFYYKVCYKFAGASENAVAINDAGNGNFGVMAAFRGVDKINPINVSGKNTKTGTGRDTYLAGVTTTLPNCLVIPSFAFGQVGASEADTNNYSSWTNADLSSITEAFDVINGFGGGTPRSGGIALAYGVSITAQEVEQTYAYADSTYYECAIITFALNPAE
jgi:hypothetical protein